MPEYIQVEHIYKKYILEIESISTICRQLLQEYMVLSYKRVM